MQKYPRGSRGSPAKGVASVTVARVQISSSAPKTDGQYARPFLAWKNRFDGQPAPLPGESIFPFRLSVHASPQGDTLPRGPPGVSAVRLLRLPLYLPVRFWRGKTALTDSRRPCRGKCSPLLGCLFTRARRATLCQLKIASLTIYAHRFHHPKSAPGPQPGGALT